MPNRNPYFANLSGGYLFPEMRRHIDLFLAKQPDAHLISLGIGDTTLPLVPSVAGSLAAAAHKLGTKEGYSGYGPPQGDGLLREKIVQRFYKNRRHIDEIFVSDGSKCDIGRLQLLFGQKVRIAVQDPVYPVYADTAVAIGQAGAIDLTTSHYQGIYYLPCNQENAFFPDIELARQADILYFCSPNNPTGMAASYEQLEILVDFALKHHKMIVYDAAYAAYIEGERLPRSIFEIEGADEVAIELGSFSKLAGFTGVRLGWTAVPKKLKYKSGEALHADWFRLVSTFFNGASNLAQAGGIAALSEEGWNQIQQQIAIYRMHCHLIKKALKIDSSSIYGGVHAPYLWVKTNRPSWQCFQDLLENHQLVITPGRGFGPAGEGYIRLSALISPDHIGEAVRRLEQIAF